MSPHNIRIFIVYTLLSARTTFTMPSPFEGWSIPINFEVFTIYSLPVSHRFVTGTSAEDRQESVVLDTRDVKTIGLFPS